MSERVASLFIKCQYNVVTCWERGSVRRITLIGDIALPCKQFWVDQDDRVWWDITYLHEHLREHGVTKLERWKWSKVERVMAGSPLTAGLVHVYTQESSQQPQLLRASACTTLGLLALLRHTID